MSFLNLVERLDRSRFEPVVVCPEQGDFLEAVLERGIPALVRSMPSLRGPSGLRAPVALQSWLKLMRVYGIDLLHANGTRAMIYSGLAGRLASKPVLWHVRVLGSDGWLDRCLARMASKVVVNSRAVAERFDFLHNRSSARRPTVLPNGVPVETFDRAKPDAALRESWRLEGKFVLLELARLDSTKRQDLAVEVLSSLRERGLNAALLLVGGEVPASRGYRSRLEKLARNLGVEEHCVFTGFRRDVPALLKQADLLIHPATDEGFGRAFIEAMASGLPILAAAGGGADEVIDDGTTGILVRASSPETWADAVEKLFRDEPLRRRLIAAGRKRVREAFSIESHVAAVERLYEEVLESAS